MENIFSEIEDSWSQEAKNEDSKRFFYHLKEIDSIEKKKKHFVIGRKGSGKSAIAKYLEKNVDYNKFAVKLNFKSFPFNVLYDLYDSGYKVPNQYITIWKYVIYSHIAKMMIKNENIDNQIREPLKDAYENDPKKLADMIKIWTSAEFKIAGTGASFKRDLVKNETGWIDKVSLLEECILTYIDESTYFIIFDELDEDYREITSQKNHEAYTSLLTSLFKAVQDIKTTFEDFPNIKPIVFLRDDIYELMKDNDKTKWAEQTLKIDWDENKLKELFRFRISRTINSSCEITLQLNEIENILFHKNKIQYGSASNRKEVSFIDYILLNTHLRPRDLIQYIKFCAEQANNENKKKITPDIIKEQEENFSNYLKSELEDEIFAIFPNINKILNIFASFHRQTFKTDDLKKFYESSSTYNELTPHEQNLEFVMKIMFHFSIIGNHPNPQQRVFKYQNKSASIEFGKSLCFHRGLFKALKIN